MGEPSLRRGGKYARHPDDHLSLTSWIGGESRFIIHTDHRCKQGRVC